MPCAADGTTLPAPPALQQTNEPSPELFERLAAASPHAGADPVVPPAEGYYPRSKSVSPVQKKIRELEVGAGAGGVGAASGWSVLHAHHWPGQLMRTVCRADALMRCTSRCPAPQAEAWGGIPFDPKPTPSRLERELGFTDFR